MRFLPELFAYNRAWASQQRHGDPDYFTRLCGIQRPEYLWIGCADSRVAPEDVGRDFDHALESVRAAGYTSYAWLGSGTLESRPLPPATQP